MTGFDTNPYPNMKRFLGKTVLITGAGSGMGRAAAIKFGREGANVVLAGRRLAKLEEVAGIISQNGGKAICVTTDVSSEAQVEQMVSIALETYGAIDLAWNNAGILGEFGPIQNLDMANFQALLGTNLTGVFFCIKHEIKVMEKLNTKGAIVNTSSWTAHGAMPGIAAYAASKGALDALTRTVAMEAGELGIRINNVSPGIIATPMGIDALGDEAAMKPFAAQAALRRVGYSEDVADVVLWLLSDDARFVTGESIMVDGGYTLGGLRPWSLQPQEAANV